MTEDATLTGDPTPFTQPSLAQMSVEEILSAVRRPERTARLYLRGDLLAERDELVAEMGRLVDARGEVIDAGEAAIGEESNAARAERLAARLKDVEAELAASVWPVRFRGMSSDDWAAFHKAHFPKGDKPDVTEFNNLLIAQTAIEPTLTVDQVKAMRQKFGARQITELANKAWEASNEGGVDVPKSLGSSQSRALR